MSDCAEKEGLDYEQEVQDGAKEHLVSNEPLPTSPHTAALAAAVESAETLEEVQSVLESVYP